ncbi:hypothetical protein GXM_07265 [Nostoc sphaeroides CCNUC1]|uniref:Uncharacterized protein n=1 Tax=Nostoc sphaeroides CCNUC1 TaxID=2653204 RepID=A0A5P8WB41_9NOSO|nr:hypothetical protein GXM_07265 [Nostoc sphaeroides CCNUC1]
MLGLLTHCVKKANIGKKAIALKAQYSSVKLFSLPLLPLLPCSPCLL